MTQTSEMKALFRKVSEQIRNHLYRAIEFQALRGLHAKAIAKFVGIGHWQVYKACRQMQIRLRDYRDGLGPVGSVVAAEGAALAKGKVLKKKKGSP